MISFEDVLNAIGTRKHLKELLGADSVQVVKDDEFVSFNDCRNSKQRYIKIELNPSTVNVKFLNHSSEEALKVSGYIKNVALQDLLETILNRTKPQIGKDLRPTHDKILKHSKNFIDSLVAA